MIKDSLQNAEIYYGLSKRMQQAFEWLKNNDLENMSDGKHYIDGEHIFANVQTYFTKDIAPFEGHRIYADIQYMINGREKIGVTNYKNCSTTEEYNKEKDIEFLKCNSGSVVQELNEGEFMIFYPQDAHQPALNYDSKKQVKKVIVKVEI